MLLNKSGDKDDSFSAAYEGTPCPPSTAAPPYLNEEIRRLSSRIPEERAHLLGEKGFIIPTATTSIQEGLHAHPRRPATNDRAMNSEEGTVYG